MSTKAPEFAQTWLSLFNLFESTSGIKLRINVLDTVIVQNGRLAGWFYTSRDGIVARVPPQDLTPQAVFQKMVGSQTVDRQRNPFQYIALAHFDTGISRPLKQLELQQILKSICGPQDKVYPHGSVKTPFCIQAYLAPMQDMRYIASFGGEQGAAACTTFARRFSLRYTHSFDDASTVSHASPRAVSAHAANRAASADKDGQSDTPPLTSEEMLVESQLVAVGLLEPRGGACPSRASPYGSNSQGNGNSYPRGFQDGAEVGGSDASYRGDYGDDSGDSGGGELALPASRAIKAEVQRTIQTLLSFIERVHGLRMQGMVAEFLKPSPDVLTLVAVHAVQWECRTSRGGLGTFTDRWDEFMSGIGPPPAVRPATKRNFAPGSNQVSYHKNGPMRSSHGDLAGAMRPISGMPSGCGFPAALNNSQGSGAAAVCSLRPGSAPMAAVQRFRGNPLSPSSLSNGQLPHHGPSSRAQSANRGTASPRASLASNSLWTSREEMPVESVTSSLALEVELLRERLQRQTDIATRAEAALAHLASDNQSSHAALIGQVGGLRAELTVALSERVEAKDECERLRYERQGLRTEISGLQFDLKRVESSVDEERSTVSRQVRSAYAKEEQLSEVIRDLRGDNEDLCQQMTQLQRKIDEGNEVIDAIKMQLVDYKSMVTTLQGQMRRGKSKISLAAPVVAGPGAAAGMKRIANVLSSAAGLRDDMNESEEWIGAALDHARLPGTSRPVSANRISR